MVDSPQCHLPFHQEATHRAERFYSLSCTISISITMQRTQPGTAGQLSNPHKDHLCGAFIGLVNTDNGLRVVCILFFSTLKESIHP